MSIIRQFFAYFISFALIYQPVILRAQIVVDPTSGSMPVLDTAQNGVPIVNIVAPTAGGVSMNKFSDFNVDVNGVVINNSTEVGVSDLAGAMYNNPLFQNGIAASTIVNYVTGTNQSRLNGFTEIFGQSAAYIMANPNGITCNGCGFINTPRISLTTGTPTNDGRYLDVNNGEITIEGNGLNASTADVVEIIARTAKLTGELHGKNVSIIAGRNVYDRETGTITTKADDGSAKPAIAIDASVLGSIYAGRIAIVSTEDGVGVQSQADMVADTGDVTLDAHGDITYNTITSAGNVSIKSNGGDIVQTRRVTAAGDVTFEAENITIERPILDPSEGNHINAGGALSMLMTQDFVNAGNLSSVGDFNLTTTGDIYNLGGTIQSDGNLTITATNLYNIGETTGGYTTEMIDVSSGPHANIDGLTILDLKEVATSTLETVTPSALYAAGDLTLNLSDTLYNNGSMIYAGNDLVVNARAIENTRGSMETDLLLTRYRTREYVYEYAPYIFGYRWQWIWKTTTEDTNETQTVYSDTPAYLMSGGNMVLNAKDSVLNEGAVIKSNGLLNITTENLQNIAADSGYYDNTGIYLGGSLGYWRWDPNYREEVISNLHSEASVIQSLDNLTITSDSILNKSSDIVSDSNITLNTSTLINSTSSITVHSLWERWIYINKRSHKDGSVDYDVLYDYRYRDGGTVYSDHVGQIIAGGDLNITDTATQTGDGTQLSNTFYSDQNNPDMNGFINVNNGNGSIIDPDGILFQYGDGAGYLIESNPLYTDIAGMLESQYWTDRLGANPEDYEIPFLGDQAYEAELIDRAVRAETGRRFIAGLNSKDQRHILLENAVEFAGDVDLTFGIDLTNAQLAQLTKPIMWYVLEEVNVGNGQTQMAYVPKLHFPTAEQAINGIGGILSGNNVMLASARDVRTTGTLHADTSMEITADNFEAKGTFIRGGDVSITAANDAHFSSLVGSYASDDGRYATSELSQIARIDVDNLTVNAGGNIDMLGVMGDIQNDLALNATGDTTIGSVALHNKYYIGGGDNFTHRETIENIGTNLFIGQNADIAGTNVNVIGSNVDALGTLNVDATENLNIIATQDLDHEAFAYKTKSTWKSTTHQEVHTTITNNKSGLSGNTVTLTSGNDTNIIGGDIYADQDLNVNTGGNLTVAGVKDSQYDMVYHKESKFDLAGAIAGLQNAMINPMSAGHVFSDNFAKKGSADTQTNYDEFVRESSLISGNNLSTYSEGYTTLLSADILSGNNATLQTGTDGNIYIGTMDERHDSEHISNEFGFDARAYGRSLEDTFTHGAEGAVLWQDTTTTDRSSETYAIGSNILGQNVLSDAGKNLTIIGSNFSATDTVTLNAGENVDILASQNRSTYSHDEKKMESITSASFDNENYSVAVGHGARFSKSDYTETALTHNASNVTGQNVIINSNEDINIIGSDIYGENITLAAGGDLTIQDVKDIYTQESSSMELYVGAEARASLDFMGLINGMKDIDEMFSGDSESILSNLSPGYATYNLLSDFDMNNMAETLNRLSDTYGASRTTAQGINSTGNAINSAGSSNPSAKPDNKHGVSAGINVVAHANMSESEARQEISNNSTVDATGHLNVTTGNDMDIIGSQVHADTADIDVGGDLNIQTVQDKSESQSWSAGLSGSIQVYGTSPGSGSINLNGSYSESEKQWAQEQASLITDGELRVDVGDTTRLVGGILGSETGDMVLNTTELVYANTYDNDQSAYGSFGLNFSFGGKPGFNYQPDIDITAGYHDKEQVNYATVGEGQINTGSSTEGLNRDMDNTQKITKDEGFDLDVSIDKRLLSPEGRQQIADEYTEAGQNLEDVYDAAYDAAWELVDKEGYDKEQAKILAERKAKEAAIKAFLAELEKIRQAKIEAEKAKLEEEKKAEEEAEKQEIIDGLEDPVNPFSEETPAEEEKEEESSLVANIGDAISDMWNSIWADDHIGELSGQYESRGDPGSFNGCPTSDPGGCSYGTYQIATNGTMDAFLTWLGNNDDYDDFSEKLNDAGGNTAATSGNADFVEMWQNLAEDDPDFAEAQYQFIKESHYDPLVNNIESNFPDFDLDSFDPVIQDVLWSIGVHHRDAYPEIMAKVLNIDGAHDMTDIQMINAIYDERAIYINGLNTLSDADKITLTRTRTVEERADALDRLNGE